MTVTSVKSSKYRDLEFVSNPTVAVNFIGFLQSYAERKGVSLDKVYVEGSEVEMFVHTGWVK